MSAADAPEVEHIYRYLRPSTASPGADGVEVTLATAGGCDAHPWLAEGFVASPRPVARSLLLVAKVAATRFWMPPSMVAAAVAAADPVVTVADEVVRFESCSLCCGVYCRLDLDADAFDGVLHRPGTTNVDLNPPVRAELARVGGRDPLRLAIGNDALEVTTLSGSIVERRVPLPARWVRGFAEVGVAMAGLEPVATLGSAHARRLLDSLPASAGRGVSWVVPAGDGLRLASRAAPGGAPVGGPERARVLRDLAPFVRSLTVYGDRRSTAGTSTTVWSVGLDGARVSIALSPSASRGFSGEGGLLLALARAHDGSGAAVRANDPVVRPLDEVQRALAGRAGYDVDRASWFARELPFDRAALAGRVRRLRDAQDLVADGGVAVTAPGTARVASGEAVYGVRLVEGRWRCTCPWWGRHGDERGPCKHIVATVLAEGAVNP
ncbi:MAG: SWIM zinc finger family protein [Acidimicrobiales bacterium]|nr:SWIM zinc finger family protein [Acidimicrobiales bacterium]